MLRAARPSHVPMLSAWSSEGSDSENDSIRENESIAPVASRTIGGAYCLHTGFAPAPPPKPRAAHASAGSSSTRPTASRASPRKSAGPPGDRVHTSFFSSQKPWAAKFDYFRPTLFTKTRFFRISKPWTAKFCSLDCKKKVWLRTARTTSPSFGSTTGKSFDFYQFKFPQEVIPN